MGRAEAMGRAGGGRHTSVLASSSTSLSLIALLLLLNLSLARASSSSAQKHIFDYGEALSKSLLYFEAQRSGRLPYDHRLSWRHHSALTDGLDQGVDLVGGYYDAGDNVKFGLPMAFTITMLAWSVYEYAADMSSANQLPHALASIKWGTDYFLKAHSEPNILWAQVGDADADHYCWQRPEDMTTSRRAYKIDPAHPGSDIAGETAAAMAAAAIVFRQRDPRYARLLFVHAQQLFHFADRYRGRYHHSVPASKRYYASVSGYRDELLWAALWLHKTAVEFNGDDSYYLEYVIRNGHEFGGTGWAMTEFSWDVKYAGVQLLVAKLLMERGQKEGDEGDERRGVLTKFQAKAEHYLCACLGKNKNNSNVRRTPGGLLFMRPWNNMQYVSNAAFLLAVYGDSLNRFGKELRCPNGAASASKLIATAKALADYILGSNPMGLSYLVGFGPKYPKKVHHRGASVVSYKQSGAFVGCTQGYDDWYARAQENPNVLVGALVGGPDEKDMFRDERWNYMQTEACTYNTAPLVGLFARMLRLGVRKGN